MPVAAAVPRIWRFKPAVWQSTVFYANAVAKHLEFVLYVNAVLAHLPDITKDFQMFH